MIRYKMPHAKQRHVIFLSKRRRFKSAKYFSKIKKTPTSKLNDLRVGAMFNQIKFLVCCRNKGLVQFYKTISLFYLVFYLYNKLLLKQLMQ